MIISYYFKDAYIFIGKEDIQRGGEIESLLSNDSLRKWPQWPVLHQTEARSQEPLPGFPRGTGSQDFGPSSTAFLGHKQGAGWEESLGELEPATIRDAGVFNAMNFSC